MFLYPKNMLQDPRGFLLFGGRKKSIRFELLKFDDFCLKSLVDLQDLLRIQPVKKIKPCNQNIELLSINKPNCGSGNEKISRDFLCLKTQNERATS